MITNLNTIKKLQHIFSKFVSESFDFNGMESSDVHQTMSNIFEYQVNMIKAFDDVVMPYFEKYFMMHTDKAYWEFAYDKEHNRMIAIANMHDKRVTASFNFMEIHILYMKCFSNVSKNLQHKAEEIHSYVCAFKNYEKKGRNTFYNDGPLTCLAISNDIVISFDLDYLDSFVPQNDLRVLRNRQFIDKFLPNVRDIAIDKVTVLNYGVCYPFTFNRGGNTLSFSKYLADNDNFIIIQHDTVKDLYYIQKVHNIYGSDLKAFNYVLYNIAGVTVDKVDDSPLFHCYFITGELFEEYKKFVKQ